MVYSGLVGWEAATSAAHWWRPAMTDCLFVNRRHPSLSTGGLVSDTRLRIQDFFFTGPDGSLPE